MGHYSDYYDQEREASAKQNNEKALKEFSKNVEMVKLMPTDDISSISWFIQKFPEIKGGLKALKHLMKML